MKRTKHKIIPKLKFWKLDKDKYYCDASDLHSQIESCGREESDIQRLMGHGYHLISDAIRGERLSSYDVQMIEHGVMPDGEIEDRTIRLTDEEIYGKKEK